MHIICRNSNIFTYFCDMKSPIYKICILTLLLALGLSHRVAAQEVLWDVNFDFRFDNREYGQNKEMVAPSETIFGAKLIPEMGLEWDNGHSIMTGVMFPATFGNPEFMGHPEWMVYYGYKGDNLKAYAGKFPRTRMIGSYSAAFFSDKFIFEDRILEGMLLQYTTPYTACEIGCDWNGHYSDIQREKFLIFSAGHVGLSFFKVGYSLTLHHHAGSKAVRGVVDNGLMAAWAELSLAELFDWKAAYVRGSWLKAYQNDRRNIGVPVLPYGFELDAGVQIKSLGARATFYTGGDLMPYYDLPYEDAYGTPYGDNLYHGDIFYHIGGDSIYGRVELFWEPRIVNGLNLRISSVHHWNGTYWGWQQVVSLVANFGNY